MASGRDFEEGGQVKLIVQPDDGPTPVLDAIERARKTLDFIIFRLDSKEIEKAAATAVARGVNVRALIAHTHSGRDKRLRQLELRMLGKGVTVSRTGSELVRYHHKLIVVDREELHVYGFNYTAADFQSRSFGIVTRNKPMVQEALRLFEADTARQEFEPTLDGFVVSPENAREQLATFIKRDEEIAGHLRPEGDRYADAPAVEPAREGRRRHPRDRQGGKARRRLSARRSCRRCGSTSARWSATATRCSSAARACGRWSWTPAARSG